MQFIRNRRTSPGNFGFCNEELEISRKQCQFTADFNSVCTPGFFAMIVLLSPNSTGSLQICWFSVVVFISER